MTDDIIQAKNVFACEIEALKKTHDNLGDDFERIITTIKDCTGKVIISGIGKPGHIAAKAAATMSSLGTSAFFLNAAEAMHGDLGMISDNDVVIFISKSGESDEIKRILPNVKIIGAVVIAITNSKESTLAKNSDIVFCFPPFDEACSLHLAPTSSTTAALVLLDAIAVVLSRHYGFTENDFGLFHPGGLLGKRLITKVADVAQPIDKSAVISVSSSFKEVISVMCKFPISIAVLIDDYGKAVGVISDGDIRRTINTGMDIYSLTARDVMSDSPKCVNDTDLAVKALQMMQSLKIHAAPVLAENKCVGIISVNDILAMGLI
jgi:arabinose-5-phosphate isomerase